MITGDSQHYHQHFSANCVSQRVEIRQQQSINLKRNFKIRMDSVEIIQLKNI